MTLCNLTNAFRSLGLNLLTFQVKELEVFKNLSSSESKHVRLSLGVNVGASQDSCYRQKLY